MAKLILATVLLSAVFLATAASSTQQNATSQEEIVEVVIRGEQLAQANVPTEKPAASLNALLEDQHCYQVGHRFTDELSGSECTCKVTVEYTYSGSNAYQHENNKWKCETPAATPATS